jgi:hypothetical protein
VKRIGIFTTDFNIRQLALWRFVSSQNDISVKMYVFTYDSEISDSEMKAYKKLFKELEFQIVPSTKGKIRLPHNFLVKEEIDVAVLYDYWYHFERQIVKQAAAGKYKVILNTMIERIMDLQKKSESFFANLHLR